MVFPENWKGYTVEKSTWDGWGIGDNEGTTAHGPMLTIKNIKDKDELQPIPIMIFTSEQWALASDERGGGLSVSAAPVPPTKIGQNAKYVFALPPRWVGFMDYERQDEAVESTKTFKAF